MSNLDLLQLIIIILVLVILPLLLKILDLCYFVVCIVRATRVQGSVLPGDLKQLPQALVLPDELDEPFRLLVDVLFVHRGGFSHHRHHLFDFQLLKVDDLQGKGMWVRGHGHPGDYSYLPHPFSYCRYQEGLFYC